MDPVPRPKGDSDVRLVQAAQDLLDERGFTGLKIREVARRAGVNLGMFHYHFKSKRNFQKRVMHDLYERFFADFRIESSTGGTPLERLRRAMVTVSRFVRDHRLIILGILTDAVHGDREVLRFVTSHSPRHILIVFSLIRECQKMGFIERMPMHLAVSVLFPALVAPNIAMAVVERKEVPALIRTVIRGVLTDVLSDATIERRVDLALRAVGARPAGRNRS